MHRTTIWAATAALFAASAAPAVAEQGPHPDHPGYGLYQQYCASCHGVNADGKGPMAPVLSVQPADLRLLSSRYGTPLPRPKLVAFIDGRERVRGHGSREMPVWGKRLDQAKLADRGHESHVRGTILVIIDYVEALQIEAPETTPAGGSKPAPE